MTSPTAWIALLVAGLLDVAWLVAVKQADGYTRFGWTLLSLVLLGAFIFLLGKAMQVLPIGTAYAVWTGIGAAGSVFIGITLFGEPATALRLIGVGIIVAGIVLLRLAPA